MILFKACPRCGGDVDATYHDDVMCVQCGHRPRVAFPGPRILDGPASLPEDIVLIGAVVCPRCGSQDAIALDKLRPEDNTCYRCRSCGHIFSPPERAAHGAGA